MIYVQTRVRTNPGPNGPKARELRVVVLPDGGLTVCVGDAPTDARHQDDLYGISKWAWVPGAQLEWGQVQGIARSFFGVVNGTSKVAATHAMVGALGDLLERHFAEEGS